MGDRVKGTFAPFLDLCFCLDSVFVQDQGQKEVAGLEQGMGTERPAASWVCSGPEAERKSVPVSVGASF